MAKYTENYNLEKPDKTEYYDVETANKNNDIIDTKLFEKQDKQAGKGLSTNDFTNEYKKKIDALQRIYKYCGSVETIADLEVIENKQRGDVYNVKDVGIDYCWNETEWTELGNAVDLSNYQTIKQANQDKQEIKDKLVVVSSTEPTGDNREKVWMQNTETEQKIYVKNDNDVYEEFISKDNLVNYSTGEQKIGTWIDGKTLYRKTISWGALPNNTSVTKAHNIPNIKEIVSFKGITYNSNGTTFRLPHIGIEISTFIVLWCDRTNIMLTTNNDRSAYTTTYITIEYTKTTD